MLLDTTQFRTFEGGLPRRPLIRSLSRDYVYAIIVENSLLFSYF